MLLLIATLIGSGPLACIVHCAIAGETHEGYHVHWSANPHAEPAASDSLVIVNAPHDDGLCQSLIGQVSDWQLSALTIGVVLGVAFVLQPMVAAFERPDHALQIRLVALPPPREPPRIAQ